MAVDDVCLLCHISFGQAKKQGLRFNSIVGTTENMFGHPLDKKML